MTTQELYDELAKRGHYPLMTLTIDDVLESYWDGETPVEQHPTEQEARKACAYINREWAQSDELEIAIRWAREIIAENKTNQK